MKDFYTDCEDMYQCDGECGYCALVDECADEMPVVLCPDCGEPMSVYRLFDEDEIRKIESEFDVTWCDDEVDWFEDCDDDYEDVYQTPQSNNRVPKSRIDYLLEMADYKVETVFGNCTVVHCKLENGFVITETSACVDPANYDVRIGEAIAKRRIADKLWELEGYLLCQNNFIDKVFEDNAAKFRDKHEFDLFGHEDGYVNDYPSCTEDEKWAKNCEYYNNGKCMD